ncbi:SpoIIE family protein phosphatase [Streptomyces cyaneofuscatus]|uniref:SpoIIE family protein phosphatase n=1 Tax=Streptomyces cyaneofuscatus TaxID=66883 RepID=A0ABZ1F039_9ACTN|nr:SpoIIE family protein phosphatase [Streptomyces cyaneofuscatus]WSB09644.1 SpoIIE family protein phosphatase [Streptomyces cyaneofuscatus]WSD46822.1 SpoIIE family protein phosphatase [Streptomyces cyaneofuscatus]
MSYAETPAGSGTPPGGLDGALLKALFAQSAVGLFVLDPQLRLVRTNSLVEGVGTEEYIGLRFTDAFRLDDPQGSEQLLKRVLAGEGPVRDHLVRGRLRRIPGDRIFLVSAYRLDGPGGPGDTALGLLSAVVDVTERERARARETTLAAVRDAVGGSLDVATTCRAFIDSLVPGFAGLAVIEVVDEVLRGADPPVGPLPPDTPLRCAASGRCDTVRGGAVVGGAVRGDEPGRTSPVGGTRRLPPRTPYALAVADLRPRLVPLTADTPWLDPDPAGAHRLAETGAHSLIVVPLTLRGAVLGLVSLYRCGAAEPFDEEDVSLAGTAATRAALAIDNARRYEREHVIASTVQRRLLPQAERHQAAVETAHVLLPGRDSGCWFDTIALSGARTALVVGGVAGEGLQSAIAMGQLRTVVQALAGLDLEPEEVLARLKETADRLAHERAALPPSDSLHGEELRAGCVYGVYDPFTRTCTVARAGHPAPLIVGPDGQRITVDAPEGPGLFADDSALFAPATVTLEEGSLLAFCTAELLADEHAEDRITQTLARPGRSLQQLGDDIVYALPDDTRSAGAALLLARTGTVSDHRVATWDLAQERTTPATARLLVRDRLQGWGLDEDTVDATELIVSELVTNAVRYGTPPLRLRLLLDTSLTCEVHDGSTASPHLRHARTVDEGGRGLFIVSRLAAHWGARHGPDGKVLWTEQELPGAGTTH